MVVVKLLRALVKHSDSRIDLNARNDSGETALMIANQRGHQDIIQILEWVISQQFVEELD